MQALGLIEVKGFLTAVAAADTALKAADVSLIKSERVRGGLSVIELVGDVAATNAAVEAGVSMAKSLGGLVDSHVIARLDPQTDSMIKADLKPIIKSDKQALQQSEPAEKKTGQSKMVNKKTTKKTTKNKK